MIEKIFNKIWSFIFGKYIIYKYKNWFELKRLIEQKKTHNKLYMKAYYDILKQNNAWISHNTGFKGIPCLPHGLSGIFISGGAKIGKNVVIFQQVTIGSNTLNDSDKIGAPEIHDNVYIGAGAKIIGNVIIGENCRIGANAVVYENMPPNSVAVQFKTRIIQKENLDNRFFNQNSFGEWQYFDDGKRIKADINKKE